MEDRLTAALHARAELVRHEDLRHHALPQPAVSHRRRNAVVALLAAACVAAVVVPLVSRDHGAHEQPTVHVPQPPSDEVLPQGAYRAPEPRLTDRLSGDVDGDGRPDDVRASGHTISVTLAADPSHPIRYDQPQLSGLAGLIPSRGRAHGIVEANAGLADGDEWLVLTLQDGGLRIAKISVNTKDGVHGVVPGYWTSWLAPDGALMGGRLDPLQHGARHLAVDVSRMTLDPPRSSSLGRWCWDVLTQQVPAPCPTGQDDAFDPGPHGSLPSLLPPMDNDDSISPLGAGGSGTWREGSVSLHLADGPVEATEPQDQVYDVVGTIDGHHVSARAGVFTPTMFKTFVDLGHGVRGLALENATDLGGWTLLSYVDHRLVPTTVNSNLHPGEVFETWIGPDKQVFTRVRDGVAGHWRLYRWEDTDTSGRYLVPVSLGVVCIDDFQQTYGTCPT
jgi:hypothetical protein